LIVVPLEHGDPVAWVDFGKGVDDMSAKEWIDVFREELCARWSVLCPVGVVTDSVIGMTAG